MTQEDMQFFEKLFRSIESEMNERFKHMDERFDQVNARLDQTNARLERIGGLVNGGARALSKISDWSEKTDVALADVLRRQAQLEERIRLLENPPKP